MCGHDGHMTCLIGGLAKILEKREIIPSNCTLRAIFQPGEEGCGGATIMINDGVLEGVDEIYGLHNVPWEPKGEIYVKPKYMMAAIDKITFRVKGKGGHSSLIHELINPVYGASLINVKINEMINSKYSNEFPSKIRICFPQMETASACNIIPDNAMLCGTLRIFDQELRKSLREDINQIVKDVENQTGCTVETDFFPVAKSPVDNDPKLTQEFINIFEGKVTSDKLPIFASEDFADYQEKVPGVFFFLAGGTECGTNLHVDNYNFNDELIERASDIYFKLVQNRFKDE
jgi:hippurate hydrolase